jgi:hypothetical protein
MANYKLNWETFDWSRFEELCILIAEYNYPDCDFQKFLKQGHKQYGTDLHSFDYKSGTKLYVQCKHVGELSENDLDTLIKKFTTEELVKKTSHFILATKVDTNTPHLLGPIDKYKDSFIKDYKIEFHCWGKLDLEKYLKNNWGIVYEYFGKEAADSFCTPQLKDITFSNLKAIKDFIPRRIFLSNKDTDIEFHWYFNKPKLEDLLQILTNERITSKRICLIGDAYQGKSTYLKHSAFLLKELGNNLVPLLIEIKDVNIEPIEGILQRNYGQWKSIPLKDIVFFIDGLDEAPTDKFREMIKHIKEFAKITPSANIILSCRKQFYNQTGIKECLEQFTLYELYSIQEEERNEYLKMILTGEIAKFLSLVKKAGIIGFLQHPFYLINLVEEYNSSGKIPKSKVDVIELFIRKAFETSKTRSIRGGKIIEDEIVKFQQIIAKFALALQFAGVNSFKYEEIQQLFEVDELELLQHNSMVQVSNNSWSFVNAIFQEHFAALLLTKLSYAQIIEFATVGANLKKIRSKWLQTISSLLSILPQNASLFKQILALVEKDNIELLFQCEPSKFDTSVKEKLLKKLIAKCIVSDSRTVVVYENTIGEFVDGVQPGINYLVECLSQDDISENVKQVCSRILRFVQIRENTKTAIVDLLLKLISKTSSSYYAGQLVQLLVAQKLGDKNLLLKLVTFFTEKHEYRDNVYELINALELHEVFYNYALEGIPYLIFHNKGVNHHGSSFALEELFISTNSRANFWKLFKKMQDDEWLEFYRDKSITSDNFIKRLFDKCIELHKRDPFIIFPIVSYIQAIGKKYLRNEFEDIDRFLDATETHKIALRLLINRIFDDNDWELGGLVTEDCYDYVLFEFEDGEKPLEALRNCISGLRYKKKNEISNQFVKLCDDATEERIFDKTHWGANDEYARLEKIRRTNDKKYIVSAKKFKEGVTKYFKAYGKKGIPANDLYVDPSDRLERRQFDSHLIFRFLLDFRRNHNVVYLKDCLRFLENEDAFDFFRAEEILQYNFDSVEDKEFYLSLLRKYYNNRLPKANFANCIWIINGHYFSRRVERQLVEIFKKFDFDTSEEYLLEMIWLDLSGIRLFHKQQWGNREKSLSELILEKLSTPGIRKLKEKILANLKIGISHYSVLSTHFALCSHLKIFGAKDEVLKAMNENQRDIYLRDVVDVYLELGGEMSEVVDLVNKMDHYDEYAYFHLILLISKDYFQDALNSLRKALNSHGAERGFLIQVAKHLAYFGDIQGFKFLMQEIRKNKESPYSIQGHLAVHNVDTRLALNEIFDLMYLVVDPAYEDRSHFTESARDILVELLYGFASKSESDLEKVVSFCEEVVIDLKKKKYESATYFNFYIDRMIENFRNSDKSIKTISEFKSILNSITY